MYGKIKITTFNSINTSHFLNFDRNDKQPIWHAKRSLYSSIVSVDDDLSIICITLYQRRLHNSFVLIIYLHFIQIMNTLIYQIH